MMDIGRIVKKSQPLVSYEGNGLYKFHPGSEVEVLITKEEAELLEVKGDKNQIVDI